jgi:hypothetical protein
MSCRSHVDDGAQCCANECVLCHANECVLCHANESVLCHADEGAQAGLSVDQLRAC